MHEGSSPSLPTNMNDNPQSFVEPEKLGAWLQAFLDEYNQALDPYLLTKYLKTNLSITRFSHQNENELAFVLAFLYYRRVEIKHYVEIGVHKGGTFYVVDQFLRQIAPNYQYGVAVDYWNRTFKDFGLKRYQQLFPNTQLIHDDLRRVPSEKYPSKGTVFFIDCDHTYDLTRYAFDAVKRRALFIIVDDVKNDRYPELKTLWEELQQQYRTSLISTLHSRLTKGNGIGVVFVPK